MKLAVRRTTSAFAAVATVGVSSLFLGVAPASAAVEFCGDGTLVAPGICEQVFTTDGVFVPTPQMSQLEVLLVGAGGSGSDQTAPNTEGYAAAGSGGHVEIVDYTHTASTGLNLTVGVPGTPPAIFDGVDTISGSNGSDGTGNAGGWDESGHGDGGSNGAVNGGVGRVVADIALAGSLFTGDVRCFGGGGAVQSLTEIGLPGCGGGGPAAGGGTLTAPLANSGGGGGGLTVTQLAAARAGASGVTIVRWAVSTTTASFVTNGHGETPAVQTVVSGTAAVKPTDPTATGYSFLGWFSDAALTVAADFSLPLTAPTTFYASWEAIPVGTVTATFEMNGHGVAPAVQNVVSGTAPVKPADPTADGYSFGGWYTTAALATPVDFSLPLTAPTTFYASWDAVPVGTVTASFEMNGHGVAPAIQNVVSGTAASKPADPTADGYTFEGWFTDAALTTPADFSLPLTTSTTFYASWDLVPVATVTATFVMNGHGVAPAAQSVLSGTLIVKPANPTADGYAFGGWFTTAALTTPVDFSVPLTASATYYASWTKVAVLPVTGTTTDPTLIGLGLAALLAGAGLVVVAWRRTRKSS